VDVEDITVEWETVETVQPRTGVEIRTFAVNAGIPLITVLRGEGWSDEQIAQLLQDQKLASSLMADTLLGQFEKGQA